MENIWKIQKQSKDIWNRAQIRIKIRKPPISLKDFTLTSESGLASRDGKNSYFYLLGSLFEKILRIILEFNIAKDFLKFHCTIELLIDKFLKNLKFMGKFNLIVYY